MAIVARAHRTVSQPTVRTQEITDGSRLPRTPYAARPSTIVGAEPRFPATATNPHSRKEKTMPTAPAASACQKEMPKPSAKAP